ncbi:MAG TPA: DUF1444 family protein [Planctomycetaceae bacterium]|nr:DUF1444 family protein [Planctomycetaceae bacterium]
MTGPSGWFRIWHPPTWHVEVLEGVSHVMLPDQAGILSLRCVWGDVPPLEDAIDFDKLFPQRRKMRRTYSLALSQPSAGWLGEAVLDPPQPWWRRWLARPQWHRWKAWAIEWPRMMLLATFVERGDQPHDPETATLVRMVLNTLEAPEMIADPPHIFAARALKLARQKFPLLECEATGEFQLRLGKSNVNLFNFYRSYVQSPDRFESILLPALTTVVQVQEWGEDQTTPSLELVRERIMPMLYPEHVWRKNFPNFVGEPWVGNLMILYVVDEAQAYWYIRNELLEKWSLTAEQLHDLAMTNLERYFDDNPTEMLLTGQEDGPKLLMPHRPDAYNTSRLLSHSFHEKLRDVLGNEFAVGMPNRDFFVALSTDAPDMVRHIRDRVREDFSQMDHPLTDKLLLVSQDGVSELP